MRAHADPDSGVRIATRDFVDVFVLASTFPRELLIERAQQLDAGFHSTFLA